MGCATSLVKYIVFIFNFLFVLAGIAFIAVGIVVKVGVDDFINALEEIGIPISVAPILMIVVGCVVFVISFFGCCGAIKESTCMLTTYAVFLLVILIAQVAIGIYVFIEIKDSKFNVNTVADAFTKLQGRYHKEEVIQEAVDALQTEMKCCGATRPGDWKDYPPFPKSCCAASSADCREATAYPKACSHDLYEFLKDSIKIIGIVVITIAAVELVGAIIALCLSSSIKNNERRGQYA